MAINRKGLGRESGNHSHLFSTTLQVLIANTHLERIRELGEREGLTTASMAGRLIDEALAARSNSTRPAAEASSAARTAATARRRDVL